MDSRGAANAIITNVTERDGTDASLRASAALLIVGSYMVVAVFFMVRLLLSVRGGGTPEHMFAAVGIVAIGGAVLSSVFYALMRRNSAHSKREEGLRIAMVDYLGACGADTADLRRMDAEITSNERRPRRIGRAVMLAVPSLVCLAAIWLPWFQTWAVPLIIGTSALSVLMIAAMAPSMTVFPRKHEERFIRFYAAYRLKASGVGMDLPEFRRTISYRSTFLFAVLTLVTLGLFSVVWIYLMFKDMNGHFDEQWYCEDALVRELRRREGGRGQRP